MIETKIKLPTQEELDADPELEAMLFGDTDSALDRKVFWEQYSASIGEQDYYFPPLPFDKLALTFRANAYHGAMPGLKASRVCRYMIDNPRISRSTIMHAIIDHQTLGNTALQLTRSKHDKAPALKVEHYPMMKVRRMKKENQYGWLDDGKIVPFKDGEIIHIADYEPLQKIYGVPFWLPALQSVLLGEAIRIWPRKFFDNGMHAEKMIVTAGLSSSTRKRFNEKLKGTKGRNAMKSLAYHFNRGKIEEMIKVFDFAENAYRIDYSKLAAMTNRDIMAAWRTPPELAGQMPENYSGSGDLNKIREMYHENEIVPLQEALMEAINPHLPSRYRLQFREFGEANSLE